MKKFNWIIKLVFVSVDIFSASDGFEIHHNEGILSLLAHTGHAPTGSEFQFSRSPPLAPGAHPLTPLCLTSDIDGLVHKHSF